MRRLSAVLVVIAIVVIGLGFHRGWFALSRPASDAGSNKVNINLAADPEKMKQDAAIVKDKATGLTGGVTDDVKADGQASDIVKSNDP
jgi:hypothetical protein